MQHLHGLVLDGVTARMNINSTAASGDAVKLTKPSEADDIQAYFTTFERLMQVYEIDEVRSALKLAP